jgi:hypothetical protein
LRASSHSRNGCTQRGLRCRPRRGLLTECFDTHRFQKSESMAHPFHNKRSPGNASLFRMWLSSPGALSARIGQIQDYLFGGELSKRPLWTVLPGAPKGQTTTVPSPGGVITRNYSEMDTASGDGVFLSPPPGIKIGGVRRRPRQVLQRGSPAARTLRISHQAKDATQLTEL